MSQNKLVSIRRQLLRWYDKVHRDLPWRRTRDPYAIWIAETMLQQTQVATVVPYYERFLKAFPNVEALDRAPLPRVLTLWSGLGYYRRATNLKKSARALMRDYGARLPESYKALRALPGVGDYTAGALLSIAFGKPYPALDANARRALGRIFDPRNEKELRATAKRLVPTSRPGYFNQGLMELGATICVPQNPRCTECPVALSCAARTANRPSTKSIPKQRKFKNVTWPLAIVRNNGKILLHRRAAEGILAGLWELPGGEAKRGERCRNSLRRHLRGLHGALTGEVRIGEVRHSITNRKIRAPIFLFDTRAGADIRLNPPQWRCLA